MQNELENHMVVDAFWGEPEYMTPHDRWKREQEQYEREELGYDRYKDELE